MKRILIDGVDYTQSCSLPILEQYTLDKSLDNGSLTLKATKRAEVFKPFSLVEIKSENSTERFYVGKDVSVRLVGQDLYNHEISLIEETKILEKIVVDTNTTTQPLVRDFSKGAKPVKYERYISSDGKSWQFQGFYDTELPFNSPKKVEKGTPFDFEIISTTKWINAHKPQDFPDISKIEKKNSTVKISSTGQVIDIDSSSGVSFRVDSDEEYIVTYQCEVFKDNGLISTNVRDIYFVSFVTQDTAPLKTITDVVNRLLYIAEPLRDGEKPRFIFNRLQANEYSKMIAPEFAMTKSTLRECLDQVGGYIHAMCRLRNGVIFFDKLSNGLDTPTIPDYAGEYSTQDCEQYAFKLDSHVENLTNIEDENDGTIVDPLPFAYKTVRASGTVRIGDGDNASAIIETTYPIEKIKSVTCGWVTVGGTTYSVGDITPYIYEDAEYQALSGTSGAFPYSKAYALYYTQGQRNIKGLLFKLPNPVSPIFENQAILNIISRKLGINVQTLFSIQNITELQFQVEYYPSVSARVLQAKGNASEFIEKNSENVWEFKKNLPVSIYNQGANKVDSRFYGENLKGAIARLGNIEKTITCFIKDNSELKKCGDIYRIGDIPFYISKVTVERLSDYCKVTYGLSKDFNALSQYIGIMNNIRLYEVSEKQAVERFVSLEDYCIIDYGGKEFKPRKHLYTNAFLQVASAYFFRDTVSIHKETISVARVRCDENETFDLPVFSLAMGNSLWFSFKFDDNYSAGNISQDGTTVVGEHYYRIQNYARYPNSKGEFEKLHIKMYSRLEEVKTKEKAISSGNLLPKATLNTPDPNYPVLIDTADAPIIIKKDSREVLNFNYQMHFMAGQSNIIIGENMTSISRLVLRENPNYGGAVLLLRKKKMKQFEDTVDAYESMSVYEIGGKLVFGDVSRGEFDKIRITDEDFKNIGGVFKSYAVAVFDSELLRYRILFGSNSPKYDAVMQDGTLVGWELVLPNLYFL